MCHTTKYYSVHHQRNDRHSQQLSIVTCSSNILWEWNRIDTYEQTNKRSHTYENCVLFSDIDWIIDNENFNLQIIENESKFMKKVVAGGIMSASKKFKIQLRILWISFPAWLEQFRKKNQARKGFWTKARDGDFLEFKFKNPGYSVINVRTWQFGCVPGIQESGEIKEAICF